MCALSYSNISFAYGADGFTPRIVSIPAGILSWAYTPLGLLMIGGYRIDNLAQLEYVLSLLYKIKSRDQ